VDTHNSAAPAAGLSAVERLLRKRELTSSQQQAPALAGMGMKASPLKAHGKGGTFPVFSFWCRRGVCSPKDTVSMRATSVSSGSILGTERQLTGAPSVALMRAGESLPPTAIQTAYRGNLPCSASSQTRRGLCQCPQRKGSLPIEVSRIEAKAVSLQGLQLRCSADTSP
jgi:hypothetical protein